MARRMGRVNQEWLTPDHMFEWQHVGIEVLMDIRSELRALNALLHCPNFVAIPTILRQVRANTSTPKRKATKKAKR